MNPTEKAVLQRLHVEFVENIDPEPFSDHLYQSELISLDDFQRILFEPTTKSKCRKLLQIVIRTSKSEPLSKFKEALTKSNHGYLADKLLILETELYTEKAITDTFEASDEGVDGNELLVILEKIPKHVQKPEEAVIYTLSNRIFGPMKNGIIMAKKKEIFPVTSTESLIRPVHEWSTDDVCFWLKTLKSPHVNSDIIENFREQAISGSLLQELTEEHLKSDEDFPAVTKLGQRLFILCRIRELLKIVRDDGEGKKAVTVVPTEDGLGKTKDQFQTSDEFSLEEEISNDPTQEDKPQIDDMLEEWSQGKRTRPAVTKPMQSNVPSCYILGDQIDGEVLQIDDLLTPANMFVDVDLSQIGSAAKVANAFVDFCSACLNDRTNGRLFIGVDDQRKVKGTTLMKSHSFYQAMINKLVEKCFFADQIEMVKRCVEPVQFVEVRESAAASSQAFVLIVDVTPKYEICEQQAFFVKQPIIKENSDRICGLDSMKLIRIGRNSFIIQTKEEADSFMAIKADLAQLRKNMEDEHAKYIVLKTSTVQRQFERLKTFLRFEDAKRGAVYPILLCNEPEPTIPDSVLQACFQTIGEIPWIAAFDFDHTGKLQKYFEEILNKTVTIVPDAAEFKENMKSLQVDVKASSNPSWIFCNGFQDANVQPSKTPADWRKEKKLGVNSAISFYNQTLPPERCVIVCLVLSENTSQLYELFEEFAITFLDQWIVLCHDDAQSEIFYKCLQQRDTITKTDYERNSLIGIEWSDMVAKFKSISKQTPSNITKLPINLGENYISITQKRIDMIYSDLNFVDDSAIMATVGGMSPSEKQDKKVSEEIAFYKGNEVSVWNLFWGCHHICTRNIQKTLNEKVKEELKSDKIAGESFISRVFLYHQPGAGATTVARQCLWNFHTMYKCVIVTRITENTADQIMQLKYEGEVLPCPMLILIDNLEDSRDFLLELDRKTNKSIRQGDNHGKGPFIVALLCVRRTEKLDELESFYLKHDLTSKEISWFQRKNEELKNRCDEGVQSNDVTDPKLLISFNIMKSNFSKTVIQEMTRELVQNIEDPLERTLLKYIALLNAYDVRFSHVPSSAFDPMMTKVLWMPTVRRGRNAKCVLWETFLSDSFRSLMNEYSGVGLFRINSFRIANSLLAKEVLDIFKNQPLSEMMLELLGNKAVFNPNFKTKAKEELAEIIIRLVRSRGGDTSNKFSPIIEDIVQQESYAAADSVITKVFEKTNNPFVAQHIARLNIESQNWQKAEEFAKISIEIKPDHSHLWDTYARVYSKQVRQKAFALQAENKKLTLEEVFELLETTRKGIEIFEKVQSVHRNNSVNFTPNEAGYLGELQIVDSLLNCMLSSECFHDLTELRRFLLEKEFSLPLMEVQCKATGQQIGPGLKLLKELKMRADKALMQMNDDRFQMREKFSDGSLREEGFQRLRTINQLKESMDLFFGAEVNELDSDMPDKDLCEIRRRCVRQIGGITFKDVYELQKEVTYTSAKAELKDLVQIRQMCHANIDSSSPEVKDYIYLIAANLALCVSNSHYAMQDLRICLDEMVHLSRQLYKIRTTDPRNIFLEPFLFYAMFNWPRKNTDTKLHGTVPELTRCIQSWEEAFNQKYPRHGNSNSPYRKREATLFFLKNGSDMNSIAFTSDLEGPKYVKSYGDSIWYSPHVLSTLQTFEGTLDNRGNNVRISVEQKGHTSVIEIQTSLPIKERTKWYKKVFFYIGFSWKGPKAYGVRDRDTINEELLYIDSTANPKMREAPRAQSSMRTQNDRLRFFTKQLQRISRLRTFKEHGKYLSKKELELIEQENEYYTKRSQLLLKRVQDD